MDVIEDVPENEGVPSSQERWDAHIRGAQRSPVPLAVLDAEDLSFRYANPPFCRLFRTSAGQREGSTTEGLNTPGGPLGLLLERVRDSGVPDSIHYPHSQSEGGVSFRGSATAVPLLDKAGRAFGLLLHLHDLSGSVLEELREANQKLILASLREQALAEQAERANRELKRLDALRKQYVALVSHDLRGPLLAAKMSGELLLREPGISGRYEQLATRVVQSLERVDQMVRSLLDAERLQSAADVPRDFHLCDLVTLAQSVIDDLSPLHGPRFLLRGEKTLVGTWSGRELQRALWNLASNAAKHGAQDGPVVITVQRSETTAVAEVHNRGLPIPAHEQARLFEPYVQAPTPAQEGRQGWGLGLFQVRQCAEAHGGSITLKSDDVHGTSFRLEIPLHARSEDSAH